jgi:hypothetical protein
MIRLRQLVSNKDTVIKDLRASKKSVVRELEVARLAVKAAEDTFATLKAQRDKAMDKAVHAGQILMRRPGVVVPDDIVKGKCALGPFLSILVIECQHKCLNVNQYPWMNKVQI